MKTNSQTHYGPYGGQYIAETLMTPLHELEKAYDEARRRFPSSTKTS